MAGAGYKLFNTGDVLTAAQVNTYLMEQTVMVFNDAASRTTALTGVVAEGMLSYLKSTKQVEVYNGSAWVASDDPNAIQNTIVDAKGDLIAATANDTPARLAVGNNGETLFADSSTSTGLRWGVPTAKGLALANSVAQSINNATDVVLSWDTEYYDTDGFHSTTVNPSRITIPTGLGGKYLVNGAYAYAANGTGLRYVSIRVNNGGAFYFATGIGSAIYDTQISFSFTLNLTAGDYFEFTTFQNSGGALNLTSLSRCYVTYLGA